MRVGIIAEDKSDVDVIREIALILLRPHKVRFKGYVGHGCGKLIKNCSFWAKMLVTEGCPWIVVVHDLDKHKEHELRQTLQQKIQPAGAQVSVILLPKPEIESWLLYDAVAIASALKETRLAKIPSNPESLEDAKKHLGDLIWKTYKKSYVNTLHNERIARAIDPSKLHRSSSFAPCRLFVSRIRQILVPTKPASKTRRDQPRNRGI